MIYIDQNDKNNSRRYVVMKSKLTKATAVALAMAMCVPASALAAGQQGTLQTSFDLYSPKLTIQVPVNADIRINPIAETSATDVKKFTVASNSIDIWNASVDVDADKAIPVNATVKATISKKADDVITSYNTFTANATSPVKKINLNLSRAQTAAVLGLGKEDDGTDKEAALDSEKRLDLSKYTVATPAVYTTPAESVAITQWGSSLSVDISGPSTSVTTGNNTFSSDATKITAAVGSFAVTGTANVSADWKADDIAVDITYDVRASQARNIATPKIATAPTFASTGTADLTITVPGIGEAKVTDIAAHNDEGEYKDYFWTADAYTVDDTTTPGTAVITIPKADEGLAYLAGDDYKTKAQDFVIALSDGRMVVTTLTVN